MKTAEGSKIVQLSTFGTIQAPGAPDSEWISGAVSVNVSEPVDLVRIRLGKMVPALFRIGVLLDNLDSPGYTDGERIDHRQRGV